MSFNLKYEMSRRPQSQWSEEMKTSSSRQTREFESIGDLMDGTEFLTENRDVLWTGTGEDEQLTDDELDVTNRNHDSLPEMSFSNQDSFNEEGQDLFLKSGHDSLDDLLGTTRGTKSKRNVGPRRKVGRVRSGTTFATVRSFESISWEGDAGSKRSTGSQHTPRQNTMIGRADTHKELATKLTSDNPNHEFNPFEKIDEEASCEKVIDEHLKNQDSKAAKHQSSAVSVFDPFKVDDARESTGKKLNVPQPENSLELRSKFMDDDFAAPEELGVPWSGNQLDDDLSLHSPDGGTVEQLLVGVDVSGQGSDAPCGEPLSPRRRQRRSSLNHRHASCEANSPQRESLPESPRRQRRKSLDHFDVLCDGVSPQSPRRQRRASLNHRDAWCDDMSPKKESLPESPRRQRRKSIDHSDVLCDDVNPQSPRRQRRSSLNHRDASCDDMSPRQSLPESPRKQNAPGSLRKQRDAANGRRHGEPVTPRRHREKVSASNHSRDILPRDPTTPRKKREKQSPSHQSLTACHGKSPRKHVEPRSPRKHGGSAGSRGQREPPSLDGQSESTPVSNRSGGTAGHQHKSPRRRKGMISSSNHSKDGSCSEHSPGLKRSDGTSISPTKLDGSPKHSVGSLDSPDRAFPKLSDLLVHRKPQASPKPKCRLPRLPTTPGSNVDSYHRRRLAVACMLDETRPLNFDQLANTGKGADKDAAQDQGVVADDLAGQLLHKHMDQWKTDGLLEHSAESIAAFSVDSSKVEGVAPSTPMSGKARQKVDGEHLARQFVFGGPPQTAIIGESNHDSRHHSPRRRAPKVSADVVNRRMERAKGVSQ